MLIGAPGEFNTFRKEPHHHFVNVGSAYLFKRIGGSWQQIKKFEPHDGQPGDRYGSSVVINKSKALIAAVASERASYTRLYIPKDSDWEGIYNFNQGDKLAGNYGSSLAMTSDYIVIGAYGKTTGLGSGTGMVYIID